MRTIFLDGSKYQSVSEFHEALCRLLNLPHYYGMNADALHDILSERRNKTSAWVFDMGTGEVAESMRKCLKVLSDLGGQVKIVGQEEPKKDEPAKPASDDAAADDGDDDAEDGDDPDEAE